MFLTSCRLVVFLGLAMWARFVVSEGDNVSEGDDNINVYFGLGCFWHIQHEFVKAEEKYLGRVGQHVTSIVGYAGSNRPGTYCYMDRIDHAEVVDLVIPKSSYANFSAAYWSMFVGNSRSHTNDRGPNYRAVIGVPGGMNSDLITILQETQVGNLVEGITIELKEGAGDDPDTLNLPHVWIYDTETYPFHQGELYHQFHDDYLASGDYPKCYEALTLASISAGRLYETPCPKERGAEAARKNLESYARNCDWWLEEYASGSSSNSDEPASSSNSDKHSNGHKTGGSGGSSEHKHGGSGASSEHKHGGSGAPSNTEDEQEQSHEQNGQEQENGQQQSIQNTQASASASASALRSVLTLAALRVFTSVVTPFFH